MFDFMILNGRTCGDRIANFTHLNFNNGPSTIDYAICNEKCYEFVSNFLVLPTNELSDHSKIVKEGLPTENEIENDKYSWKPMGILYKWDQKRQKDFNTKLRTNIEDIEEINQRIDAGLVHSAGEQIQNLFIKTAKATLQTKLKNISKNWKKRKNQKNGLTATAEFLKMK